MRRLSLWRRSLAEFLGTGLLVTVVVGPGIAAQRLSTDPGLQLLENSIATALGLGVLILLLAPLSGAHFNPVVSLADTLLGLGRAVKTNSIDSRASSVPIAHNGSICVEDPSITTTRISSTQNHLLFVPNRICGALFGIVPTASATVAYFISTSWSIAQWDQ